MSPLLAAIHVPVLTTIVPALVAGAAAVYVLLPRPKPHPWWLGALLGAVAVLLAGALILRTGAVTPETFLFYAFSLIAVVSGGLLVTQHHPARAALSFAVVILSTSGLFLLLAAPFLAAASIIIYAGAIIVTFLFVLMLAQQAGLGDADARSREPLLAAVTGFVLLGALVYVLQLTYVNNDTVQTLDQMLARTRAAKERVSGVDPAEFQDLLNPIREPLADVRKSREAAHTEFPAPLKMIGDELDNTGSPQNTEEMTKVLDDLEKHLLQARQGYGWLRPHSGPSVPMSDLSGPSANEPAVNLRYDDEGRPQLPADNPAYLGRSLFTDYLLPVELGGFLLLIAVVGSIAIAHRQTPTTPERPA